MAFLGALSFGFLTDTCNFRKVLVLRFGLMAARVAGFLLLDQYPSTVLLFASVITFGFAVAGDAVVIISDLQARFGARSFSYVFGIWYSFFAAALFGAPILIGKSFDTTGNYRLGFTFMLATVMAAGALFILLPNKVPHSRD